MSTITVQYPTIERKVIKTLKEAKAMGYKNEIVQNIPVNRPQTVTVKQVSRKVQEEFMGSDDYNEELKAACISQTGMTPEAYQAKFKRAWND